MNKFIEFSVYTTHDGGDLVSDVMWNYTDSGVVIEDVEDVIALSKEGKSWDYADESIFSADKRVIVKAYFPKKEQSVILDVEKDLRELKSNSPFDLGTLETVKREVDGDAWKEQWKQHFKPIHIGEKVVVVPEWIKYDCKPQEIQILLDSNMAFGTGEHETTSMCVEYLSKFVKSGDTVLDVGCGSGILGITASKLGAKSIIMTDIDECAVVATKHNMELNKVTNGIVLFKNLLDDNTVKGDVIVANIMAELLISFSVKIGDNLNKNGLIILSGILTDRLDKVIKAYENAGFIYVEHKIKGEWSALVMKKETL